MKLRTIKDTDDDGKASMDTRMEGRRGEDTASCVIRDNRNSWKEGANIERSISRILRHAA